MGIRIKPVGSNFTHKISSNNYKPAVRPALLWGQSGNMTNLLKKTKFLLGTNERVALSFHRVHIQLIRD